MGNVLLLLWAAGQLVPSLNTSEKTFQRALGVVTALSGTS